jgi:hypothetical protein
MTLNSGSLAIDRGSLSCSSRQLRPFGGTCSYQGAVVLVAWALFIVLTDNATKLAAGSERGHTVLARSDSWISVPACLPRLLSLQVPWRRIWHRFAAHGSCFLIHLFNYNWSVGFCF